MHDPGVVPPKDKKQDREDNEASQSATAGAMNIARAGIGIMRQRRISLTNVDHAMNGHALERSLALGRGFAFGLEFKSHSRAGLPILTKDLEFH